MAVTICKAFSLAINLASSHAGGYYDDPNTGEAVAFNERNLGAGIVCALTEDRNTKLQLGFYTNSYDGLPRYGGGVFEGSETKTPYFAATKVWDVAEGHLGTFKLGGSLGLAYYSMGEEVGLPTGNLVPLAGLTAEFEMKSGVSFSANVMPLGGERIAPGNPDYLATLQMQVPLGAKSERSEAPPLSAGSALTPAAKASLIQFGNALRK